MAFSFNNLKSGALVEMAFVNEKKTDINLKTIVENVVNTDQLILFAPVHKGVNYPLRINQGFNLITVNKQGQDHKYTIYACRCRVIERMQIENISIIKIQRTGDMEQVQRRDYFRLPLIKNMTFLYENRVHQLLSKDLSGNGLKGYIDIKLPFDAEGVLQLDTGDQVLALNFKVIDCHPDPESTRRYEIRLSFVRIKNAQRTRLLKYIYSKQSETIRKQIDFKGSPSLIHSYENYADYFDIPTKEKIARLLPIVLWCMTLINLAYLLSAFRDLDMGLNYFFKEFQRSFRPEFLNVSIAFSVMILLLAIIGMNYNEFYNKRTRFRVRIHLLIMMLISTGVLVVGLMFGQ